MRTLGAIVLGMRGLFFLGLVAAGILFIGPFATIFQPTCLCEYTIETPLCSTMLVLADFFFSGLLIVAGLFGLYRMLPSTSGHGKIRFWGWGALIPFCLGLGVTLGYFLHRLERFM